MKKLLNCSLLLIILLAGSNALTLSAQDRRPARRGTQQQPPRKGLTPSPTPTPQPTPAPVQIRETPLPPGGRARFDVTHYRIEAELVPDQHQLNAVGDVVFTPLDNTRSVVFELNGSLKVDSIERNGKPLTNFVQDAAGYDTTGPSVRVDLGEVVRAGQPQTLRFRWSGALVTPEGGPLASKRLAFVGTDLSYLMYAARWFPFHDYAADRATSEMTITVPAGYMVAGASDQAVTPQARGAKAAYRFVQREPALIGNFAAARYVTRTLRIGNFDIQFHVLPGSERFVEPYGQLIGSALDFYTRKYGQPIMGTRLVVAQIDDESLDAYAAPGMQFLSARFFGAGASQQQALDERLQRELAYQWWGHTVGLKTFDDAWLSQGLAEWSSFALRETKLQGTALETVQRDMLERALMFEQAASIARAPSTLDDQSAAYQAVVFYKGAMVFRMLRESLGAGKFDELMRRFFNENRGKNASIDDFERLTTTVAAENMRYFFARWVEGTGVPEFTSEYQIIRTRGGKFRARGTVKQNTENLRLPVDVSLRAEGDDASTTIFVADRSEDFDFESVGKPLEVIIDPNHKVLHTSEELRVSVVARRGLELFREGQYLEAQRQLEEALKLDKSNSWVYYNLGLIYLEQRNYDPAIDNFKAALQGSLRPTWIEAWAHIKMGNAYDAKGDRARAVNEYKKAVDTDIEFDNARKIAQEFIKTPYDPKASAQQASTGAN